MIERMKNQKIGTIASSILSILFGALLVFCPEETIIFFAKLVALLLILAGIVYCVSRFLEPMSGFVSYIVGGIIILIGLWIFLKPTAVVQIVPIAIGVLLVVHGIQNLTLAFEARKHQAPRWWMILLTAILNIAFGIVCICNAFGLIKMVLMIAGFMVMFDGVTSLFAVGKVKHAAGKVVDATVVKEEDVSEDDYDF